LIIIEIQKFVYRCVKWSLQWPVFFATIIGFATIYIFKEVVTSFYSQLGISKIACYGILLLLFLILFFIYRYIFILINRFFQTSKNNFPFQSNINFTPSNRLNIGLGILICGMAVILIFNNVLPHLNTTIWSYGDRKILPTMNPVGNDFRVGLYRPPQALLKGENIYAIDGTGMTQYPPLVNFLYLPYQLLSENNAYLVHTIIQILANIICLGIATRIVKTYILPQTGFDDRTNVLIAWVLFLALIIFTFTSYPFLFSIERGNYDIIAVLFALLAVDNLLRKPDQIWVQVILLSIAVHLKIYPAALFILLIAKHGKKLILPVLAINIPFILVLGPKSAIGFFQILNHSMNGGDSYWIGNHSWASFAAYLSGSNKSIVDNFHILLRLFRLIPIVCWVLSVYILLKQKLTQRIIAVILMVTLPLMDLVPTISHDYKSVILGPGIIVFLGILLVRIIRRSNVLDYIQLIVVVGFILIIGRSFVLNPSTLTLLNQKYAVIAGLAALMLFNLKSFINLDQDKLLAKSMKKSTFLTERKITG